MEVKCVGDMSVAKITSKLFYPCAMLTEMEEDGEIPDGSAAAYSFFYHVSRVATMAHQYACYYELGKETENLYYKSGLLHDFGKLGDKDLIRMWATQKRLRGMKREKVRWGHVDKNNFRKGLEIAGINAKPMFDEIRLVALYHHVRNSVGQDNYPDIHPKRLPKIVTVIGIIDAFEAIISTLRPYNKKNGEKYLCSNSMKPITWTQAIKRLSKDVEAGKFEEKLFWEVSEALTSAVPLSIVHLPNLLGHYV
ncbi:MAG TPA: HD domain-containing protein [Patescibacteria group bacterium]|nr:HD domain-containing protein [Patescibacteria group bacterium]